MDIVCTGGRDFIDAVTIGRVLAVIAPNFVYVGDCPTGADRLVHEWCEWHACDHKIFEADWKGKGKAAGPMRNAEMLRAAEGRKPIVVAFPGGRGTADCVRKAKAMGMLVLMVQP